MTYYSLPLWKNPSINTSVKIQMGSGPIQSVDAKAVARCEQSLKESDIADWVFLNSTVVSRIGSLCIEQNSFNVREESVFYSNWCPVVLHFDIPKKSPDPILSLWMATWLWIWLHLPVEEGFVETCPKPVGLEFGCKVWAHYISKMAVKPINSKIDLFENYPWIVWRQLCDHLMCHVITF